MGRKYKKGDEFKVGSIYGYATSDNQFKLLGLYGLYGWVEWQGEYPEIETILLDPKNLKQIIFLK